MCLCRPSSDSPAYIDWINNRALERAWKIKFTNDAGTTKAGVAHGLGDQQQLEVLYKYGAHDNCGGSCTAFTATNTKGVATTLVQGVAAEDARGLLRNEATYTVTFHDAPHDLPALRALSDADALAQTGLYAGGSFATADHCLPNACVHTLVAGCTVPRAMSSRSSSSRTGVSHRTPAVS